MRRFAALLALPLLGAAPAGAPSATPVQVPGLRTPVFDPHRASDRCPDTPMSVARREGERLRARPLAELPPAQAFAAVDRRIDNCPAPMLLTETRR
jgi:hypothetical protein